MHTRLMLGLGVAAGCAVGAWVLAGASTRSSARRGALEAVAAVTGTPGPQDAPSGGVIPLESVPLDQLSEWELDLLTTPDS